MALSQTAVAAVLAVVFLLAVLVAVFYGILQSKGPAEGQKQAALETEAEPVAGGARRNAASRMQARRRRAANEREVERPSTSRGQPDSDGSASGSEDDEDERAPLSKKERKQEERQQEREARLAAQQAKENKSSAYDEKRRAKDDQREAARKAQEDEMKRAEDERLKKEEEEAAQWMSMISVEQEGTGETDDQEESQGLLAQFIDYIKQRKTVPLEELATEFKLRTTDVIDRVQGLEAMGRLTGVMDERGKYIYISTEEMQAVANYITTKGRVAISELAAKSNTFIDLELKAAAAETGAQPSIDFDSLLGAEGAAE